jgi:hypothetical protein
MSDVPSGLEDPQRSRGSEVSDLPPGLEDFGARLKQAARRDVTERRRASRGRRRLRDIGLPLAAALAAAAVSASAVRLADRAGDPIAPERGSALTNQAAKDTSVIEASAVANPSGGPPWVVRAYTAGNGGECIQLGRLRDGVFGQVQAGRFRPLPASAPPGACANRRARDPRVAVSQRPIMDLTVVYGLAVDPAPVTVSFGAQRRRLHRRVRGRRPPSPDPGQLAGRGPVGRAPVQAEASANAPTLGSAGHIPPRSES